MLTVLFFVLGIIGAFVVLLVAVITVAVIAVLPYRLGSKKDITWEVDLRNSLPPVTKQIGNSCACHAAAAVLGFNGINIPDPNEWYKDVNFWGVWGRDDGLDNRAIYSMLTNKVGIDGFNILGNKQIIPAIKAGKPVFVAITAMMHTVGISSRYVPFEKQNLSRGYKLFRILNRYAKKPLLSNHAMVVCGIDDDNELVMVRDSAGSDRGQDGYWVMPVSMLLDSAMENCAIIVGN